MSLTRPKFAQVDTTFTAFKDPITILHQGSTSANVDVGFLFNRANGLVSNVALYWNEETERFVTAYTSSSGDANSNLTPSSFANIQSGNVFATGFFYSNGAAFVSSSNYGNTEVAAYLPANPTITGIQSNVGAYQNWANARIGTLDANLGTATTNITTLFSNAAGQATAINTINANLGTATTNITTLFSNAAGQANQITGANAAIVTANNAVVSFIGTVNNNLSIAITANTNAANAAATTANTNLKSYVDGQVSGVTSAWTANASTQATAINTINANLGTATTNITTLLSNAAGQANQITGANAAIVTANTGMKSYVDGQVSGITSAWTANAATQATELNTVNANIGTYGIWANSRIATLDANLGTATTNITGLQSNAASQQTQINSIVTNANANVAAYLPTYSGSLNSLATLSTTGSASIGGILNVTGNLNVAGNVSYFSSNDLVISDSMIYLADDNTGDVLDIGIISSFTNPTYQHTGLVRDSSDGIWKLFANVVAEPTTTVDFTNATYSPLRVGTLTINNVGDVSANLGTATTNIATLFSNAAVQANQITGANAAIVTANTGMKSYVDGRDSSITSAWTANAATQATAINTINANLGTATTNITTLFGNAATQQTQINSIVTNANANVAAYLPIYSGSLGGTLTTASQTNITSVGTLSGVIVNGQTLSGNISGTRLRVVESGGSMYMQAGNGVSGSGSTINFAQYLSTTSALSVDLTNLRVGIGQTSPAYKLDVYSTGVLARFQAASGNYGAVTISDNSSTSGVALISNGNDFAMQLGGTERFRLTSAGALTGPTIITVGNIITTNGVYWANGAAYSSGSGGGTLTYTAATTTPLAPTAGSFWYDTATDTKYQYINDGTSSYWVDQSYPTSFGNLTVANTLTVGGTIDGTTTNSNYATTANVAIYESVTATTTNAAHYPMLSGTASGNTASFTSSSLVYNPSTGNLVIAGTTASSTKLTGALVVKGGIGVSGQVTSQSILVDSGNTSINTGEFYSVSSNTTSQLGIHATGGVNNRQSKIKFYGTFYSTPADVGERYVTSIRSGFDSTSNAWGSEFLGVYVNNTTNDANTDASQTLIANFSNYGGLRTFSNLVATNGSLYSQNLLLQGDGTNAYIRPRNAGSGLYLGAADGNYVNITPTQTIFTGNVTPAGNLSYNLGTPTAWWNNVYGKAVQAQYADLAEHYTADAEYPPGTVVVFGGLAEITTSDISHDPRTAGVISTDPAYLMNASTPGLPVALTGRVPCYVQGPVTKGDRLVNVSAGVAGRMDKTMYEPGCIIGKSLESIKDDSIKLIEIAVGRY